jgi:simple sugar transport system substrate-binding protein
MIKQMAAATCVVASLAACGSSTTKAAPATTVAAAGTSAPGTATTAGKAMSDLTGKKMVNVVKLTGIGWFDRMQTGIEAFKKDTKADASQTGPAEASPEQQVKMISDLIAQKPLAITVVPNSPESVEGVMKQAKDAGIIVITHENAGAQNVDADIEAFDNTAYGAHIMDSLAECMGKKGKYAAFVGAITAKSHVQWTEGALARAKEKYPDITRVADPVESKESADTAYAKTKELLQKYPDLTGIEGSASVDVAGIGRAVQELGLQSKVCVMGTSIPSVAGKYLTDGSVDKIFFWDPALAGQAMMKMAALVKSGTPIASGTNLGLSGYEKLTQSPDNPKAFFGSAWLDVDAKNAAQYPF